MSNYKDNPPL